ncbi:MAG: Asp-tRNA(Asn)/Glu-tRNA(Gln) amidotransferase subunit GatC [Candidatus Babeliales bacterium]
MSILSKEELKKLAQISSLQIKDEELSSFSEQINGVLAYAARVADIAKDVSIASNKRVNVFREDVVVETDKEEVLRGAPEREQDYFVVPVIIQSNK